MKIYMGADHAGFATKEMLKDFLKNRDLDFEDLSPNFKEGDDYPDHAFRVAEKVAKEKGSKGILVCGTGTGMAIAANKVKGIRAVDAFDPLTAKLSREHNDTNVLALGPWEIKQGSAKDIVSIWLNTKFSGEERHVRRLNKISKYEK